MACANRLTRLDIGYIHPSFFKIDIPLTPHLEVLAFTPEAASFFSRTPPPTLRVLIVHTEELVDTFLTKDCKDFVKKCTTVTSLAVVDDGKIFFIHYDTASEDIL
jgi:hypothetical protein